MKPDPLKNYRKRKLYSLSKKPKTTTSKTMNEVKNPFASKTIWGAILVLVGIVGNLVGVDVPKDEIQGIISQLAEMWPELVQVFGAVLAIIGRFKAEKSIQL